MADTVELAIKQFSFLVDCALDREIQEAWTSSGGHVDAEAFTARENLVELLGLTWEKRPEDVALLGVRFLNELNGMRRGEGLAPVVLSAYQRALREARPNAVSEDALADIIASIEGEKTRLEQDVWTN